MLLTRWLVINLGRVDLWHKQVLAYGLVCQPPSQSVPDNATHMCTTNHDRGQWRVDGGARCRETEESF